MFQRHEGEGNTGSTETSLLAPASHLGKLETVWGGKCPALSESDFQPASPAAAYRRGARVARGSVAGRVATDGGLLLRGDEVVELLAGGRGLRRRLAASHQHIRTAGRVAQHQHLRRESAIRARRVRRVRRAQRGCRGCRGCSKGARLVVEVRGDDSPLVL